MLIDGQWTGVPLVPVNFVSKMMNLVLKMMFFVLKMMITGVNCAQRRGAAEPLH